MKITTKTFAPGTVYIDENGLAWVYTGRHCTSEWTSEPNVQNIPREPECECGAFKSMGAARGAVGHSNWCPWAK